MTYVDSIENPNPYQFYKLPLLFAYYHCNVPLFREHFRVDLRKLDNLPNQKYHTLQ